MNYSRSTTSTLELIRPTRCLLFGAIFFCCLALMSTNSFAQTINHGTPTIDRGLIEVTMTINGSVNLPPDEANSLLSDIFGEDLYYQSFLDPQALLTVLADTIKGKRNPISSNVIVPKLPKRGDTLVIDWSTPQVTITITGKVTQIDQDGLCTIMVTNIKGQYKGVITGLQGVNSNWSINLTER